MSTTLLRHIDKCSTAMGSRLIRRWLIAPLMEISEINQRINAVDAMLNNQIRAQVRELLKNVYDLERLATKISQQRINPRELLSFAYSIENFQKYLRFYLKSLNFNNLYPKIYR